MVVWEKLVLLHCEAVARVLATEDDESPCSEAITFTSSQAFLHGANTNSATADNGQDTTRQT